MTHQPTLNNGKLLRKYVMNLKKTGLFALVIALIASYFIFDLGQYLSLDYFEAQRNQIIAYTASHPLKAAALYFAVYVLVTGLSLPGAAVMTLIGGAIFGLFEGTLLVSFASTLGATTAFIVSRLLLRDWVQNEFKDSLRSINQGVEREGAFYLFGLRLVPLFPFFVINLVMGLTPLKTRTFFWVSQLGMLPGTIVYVNAGTQLGQIESTSGILSPGLIGSFALLGIFPFFAKRLMEFIKSRKAIAQYPRPNSFDSNLVVIGAGSAGLVTSYIAAAIKPKYLSLKSTKWGETASTPAAYPARRFFALPRWPIIWTALKSLA